MGLKYQLYRAKYRYARQLGLNKPVDVSLELASICNMKCSYCYHHDNHPPFTRGMMHWKFAKPILEDAAKIGVNSLKMNYRGESTLNKHFERICEYARRLGKHYGGSTFIDRISNSNFKFDSNRHDIFRGLSHQTKVKVSFDSFRKEVFEKQRKAGNHDTTSRNIDIFYNYPARRRSNTRIVIQAVRTSLNADEDIEAQAKKRWPNAEISIRDMVAGRVENDKVKELEIKKRDADERKPCLQAFNRLMITWDGKVQVCCPDIKSELEIGDAKKQGLLEIFNSEKAKKIRENLKNKAAFEIYDACKNCSSFESYKNFKPNWNS